MYDKSFRSLALVWIAAGSLLSAACGDDGNPPAADETGATSSADTTGSGVSLTGQNPTTNADTTADGTTGMADGTFLDPSTGGDGPMPQPNGAPCEDNSACVSEFCFVIPMVAGVCSECLADTDCATGTCSLDAAAAYAICTDGSIGVMCDSDEGCMGDLVCTELINTGGLYPLDFCSECRNDDAPCQGDQVCSPVYDLLNFAGYMGCVDPGSVPNDGGCPLVGPVGDGTVCMSGSCGVASLFGLIPIGVCGDCLTDMDCAPMQTCQPPAADMAGLVGATCM